MSLTYYEPQVLKQIFIDNQIKIDDENLQEIVAQRFQSICKIFHKILHIIKANTCASELTSKIAKAAKYFDSLDIKSTSENPSSFELDAESQSISPLQNIVRMMNKFIEEYRGKAHPTTISNLTGFSNSIAAQQNCPILFIQAIQETTIQTQPLQM